MTKPLVKEFLWERLSIEFENKVIETINCRIIKFGNLKKIEHGSYQSAQSLQSIQSVICVYLFFSA